MLEDIDTAFSSWPQPVLYSGLFVCLFFGLAYDDGGIQIASALWHRLVFLVAFCRFLIGHRKFLFFFFFLSASSLLCNVGFEVLSWLCSPLSDMAYWVFFFSLDFVVMFLLICFVYRSICIV